MMESYRADGGGIKSDSDTDESQLDVFLDYEPDTTDDIRTGQYALGLNKDYVPSWTRADGFREWYQNWKDGIIASFSLDPRSFNPQWNETRTAYEITVHCDATNAKGQPSWELLGFIRFNKKAGSVELANFKASLTMRNLSLGGTTKRGQGNKFAGVHGEGFKIAALVMTRNNHHVRISSTSHYWNFGFRGIYKDRFSCNISEPSPKTIDKEKASLASQTRQGGRLRTELKAYAVVDVTVKISKGKGENGRSITESEFKEWTAVSLDLHAPPAEGVIRTYHGDLLLGDEFACRIYLKGLRVAGHAPDGRRYSFGYNFARGHINRDRERMTNPVEEAETLASIWEAAIKQRGQTLMRRYIALFDHDSADVTGAQGAVSKAMAQALWESLREDMPNAFFYSDTILVDSAHQADMIASDLKKQPRKLPKELWKILKAFSLVRTPQEERLHIFASSHPVAIPEDRFSRSIDRMLRSAMLLDRRLEAVKTEFVTGANMGIDMHYREDTMTLLIHQKWLDFEEAHEESACDIAGVPKHRRIQTEGFSCDHIVEDLFELVINIVRGPLQITPSDATSLRRQARVRLRQTPQNVKLVDCTTAGCLHVSWNRNEGGSIVSKHYAEDLYFEVTLHKLSSCEGRQRELIQEDAGDNTNALCECPRQAVPLSACAAVFRGLDPRDAFFPLVARRGDNTFFGVPPAPISPAQASKSTAGGGRNHFQLHELIDTDSESSWHEDLSPWSAESSEIYSATPQVRGDSLAGHAASPSDGINADLVEVQTSNEMVDNVQHEAKHDDNAWEDWHTRDLPQLLSHILTPPTKCQCDTLDSFDDTSFVSEQLNYTFEKDMYVEMQDRSTQLPSYIALVHDVYIGSESCIRSPHLSITKYSLFKADELLCPAGMAAAPGNDQTIDRAQEELLLHFSEPKKMGTSADAEVVIIDDIVRVRALSPDFEIKHCVDPIVTDTPCASRMFCRFARSVKHETLTIMPVGPHLLPPRGRPKISKFTDTSALSVLDLTPNVLGPLEGFTEAGYKTFAGMGFDESRHATWRVRNPTCPVFDGSPQQIFNDITYGRLKEPAWPFKGSPKVALAAGENSVFRLSEYNDKLPTADVFLHPLGIVDSVTASAFVPDFTVLQMSSALLHPSVIGKFSATLSGFLEKRQMVRISLASVRKFGALQNRTSIAVIGSPLQGLAFVPIDPAGRQTGVLPEPSESNQVVRGVDDLAFRNRRMINASQGAFVCSSAEDELEESTNTTKYIYNHQTGHEVGEGEGQIVADGASHVDVPPPSCRSLIHPDRRDRLTVRELARLQGFKDDFVFYGSNQTQYLDVSAAQPPAVARALATCIRTVIQRSREIIIREGQDGQRPNKRRKGEGEEDT